jgi:hypothetical protein
MSEIDLVDIVDSKIYHALRTHGYGPVDQAKFEALVEVLTAVVLDALDEYSDIVEAQYQDSPIWAEKSDNG